MYPKPKPQKGAKKKANEKRKRELTAYRKVQYELAVERDKGGCRICEMARYMDIHHIFGRGRRAGDWQECFTNLLCVCRKCHPPPIKHKPASKELQYIVDIQEKINE